MKMKFQLIVLFSLIVLAYSKSTCVQSEVSELSQDDGVFVGNEKPLTIQALNSDSVTQAALNATHLFNQQNNSSKHYYKLVCIKSGTTQIISGVIYKLDVTLQKTECLKSDLFDDNETGLLSARMLDNIENCGMNNEKINTVLKFAAQPWKDVPYTLL